LPASDPNVNLNKISMRAGSSLLLEGANVNYVLSTIESEEAISTITVSPLVTVSTDAINNAEFGLVDDDYYGLGTILSLNRVRMIMDPRSLAKTPSVSLVNSSTLVLLPANVSQSASELIKNVTLYTKHLFLRNSSAVVGSSIDIAAKSISLWDDSTITASGMGHGIGFSGTCNRYYYGSVAVLPPFHRGSGSGLTSPAGGGGGGHGGFGGPGLRDRYWDQTNAQFLTSSPLLFNGTVNMENIYFSYASSMYGNALYPLQSGSRGGDLGVMNLKSTHYAFDNSFPCVNMEGFGGAGGGSIGH
jgi:hypothetical protein